MFNDVGPFYARHAWSKLWNSNNLISTKYVVLSFALEGFQDPCKPVVPEVVSAEPGNYAGVHVHAHGEVELCPNPRNDPRTSQLVFFFLVTLSIIEFWFNIQPLDLTESQWVI
jgi:hypothetical protein